MRVALASLLLLFGGCVAERTIVLDDDLTAAFVVGFTISEASARHIDSGQGMKVSPDFGVQPIALSGKSTITYRRYANGQKHEIRFRIDSRSRGWRDVHDVFLSVSEAFDLKPAP